MLIFALRPETDGGLYLTVYLVVRGLALALAPWVYLSLSPMTDRDPSLFRYQPNRLVVDRARGPSHVVEIEVCRTSYRGQASLFSTNFVVVVSSEQAIDFDLVSEMHRDHESAHSGICLPYYAIVASGAIALAHSYQMLA